MSKFDSGLYSDGSLSTQKAADYGYVIHRNGLTLTGGSGRLGPAEVFDAEVKAAFEGLRAALSLPSPQHIFVCLDNLAVATCLRGMPADSSQEVFLEFQALATTHCAIDVLWTPGHTNIPGNEQADASAKAATSFPEPADALPTLAHLRRTARQQPRDAFGAPWDASAPDQYKPTSATVCFRDLFRRKRIRFSVSAPAIGCCMPKKVTRPAPSSSAGDTDPAERTAPLAAERSDSSASAQTFLLITTPQAACKPFTNSAADKPTPADGPWQLNFRFAGSE
ncbi:hypothetical protein PCL_10488 [Purpureocillium lilacinum]|uniref:RNase H type-1 domain-containing protein n=1 Tax=Purpureocillium lilacinum TaxID=33203 RepID=A0A2U3DQ90_PURLI|nr:hypothetical protein PCL_10488 [Purpureocillium lilacinum]